MGEEFYCILKLVSGEEVISLIAIDENDGEGGKHCFEWLWRLRLMNQWYTIKPALRQPSTEATKGRVPALSCTRCASSPDW